MPWEVADRDHPERAGSRWPKLEDAARAQDKARPVGRFFVRWVGEGMRPATMQETDDWLAGHLSPPMARETPEGLEVGYIHPGPSKACSQCAAIGRLTWLADDGSCRRSDAHRR